MLVSYHEHNHKATFQHYRGDTLSSEGMTTPSRSLVIHAVLQSVALLVWMLPLCGFLWASTPSDRRAYHPLHHRRHGKSNALAQRRSQLFAARSKERLPAE